MIQVDECIIAVITSALALVNVWRGFGVFFPLRWLQSNQLSHITASRQLPALTDVDAQVVFSVTPPCWASGDNNSSSSSDPLFVHEEDGDVT